MLGGTAIITTITADDLKHQKLWTLDTILDFVCKGLCKGRERDAEALHMVDVWVDQAHMPILVTILKYAGLRSDLRPNTMGRYTPVAAQAWELKDELEVALMRDAALYFEPPLNDEFMRQKYMALYIFHFVDDGLRFDLRRDPSLYQRAARSGLI